MTKSNEVVGKRRPNGAKKSRIVSEKKRSASAKNIRDYREKLGRSPHEKHGISLVINSNGEKLPDVPYAGEIREGVEALIAQAEQDLGGPDQVTASQRAILQSQKLCLLILGLGAHYLASEGVVNRKTGKAQALLGSLAAYVNSARLNSLALGLTRTPKDANLIDMKRYEKTAARETEKDTDGPDSH